MKDYNCASCKPYQATGYEIGLIFIVVQFKNGSIYRYSNTSCGPLHVSNMKTLAIKGAGLSEYIIQYSPVSERKREVKIKSSASIALTKI